MPELAEKLDIPPAQIRRFYLSDMTEKGRWVIDRLVKVFPNQNERSVIGWLNVIISENEFLCLALGPSGEAPKAVCFAQRVTPDTLSSKPIIREIFVWCEDPDNALLQQQAGEFYSWMAKWAKDQGIDKLILMERSDVPIATVREKFGGKLHEFKTVFARV